MTVDFAKRAYDHSFPFDPIVRSLLDTDFYKLLMLQLIWEKHPSVDVTFAVTNRTKSIRIADCVDIDELRQQLDHVRSLRFSQSELIWLRGQTFYGTEGIFKPGFIDFLRRLQLPEYELRYETVRVMEESKGFMMDEPTGQFVLEFPGKWTHTTLWEIYALTILNELRYRSIMRNMNRSQLDIMYARAKVKLYAKLERLSTVSGLSLTDFGTRRRHSHLWQEHCILTACEVLGDKFTGTSNAFFAMEHGLEARGTNAHELPMVMAALATNEAELAEAPYKVLKEWQNEYHVDALKVMLPDTFGTTHFLKNAPEWVRLWTGARPDSKDPIPGGEELIEFWQDVDPLNVEKKLIIFSDGMDVEIPGFEPHGADIPTVHNHFNGRVRVGIGFGTMFTNDFVGAHPLDTDLMRPISLVCKVKEANGRPAVKLSDVKSKSTGPVGEIARYRSVFGEEGVIDGSIPIV